MGELAVAIVNYNTRNLLRDCLLSVLDERPREVVVVDNASQDESVTLVRSHFPQVTLLTNATNVGFGAAANRAIAACTAPAVLLLNSDTRLCPGALRALARVLDREPHVGIVGPRLIGPDGRLQQSCFPFPTPFNRFLELNSLPTIIRALPVVRERYPRTWRHDRPRVVPWVLGAALAIRREAFATAGGFDEALFMYFEETDLCRRLLASGWRTLFTPEATVVHVGGASTVQDRERMISQLFASLDLFYQRHYTRRQRRQLSWVIITGMLAKIARDIARRAVARDVHLRDSLGADLRIWRRILADARNGGG